MTNEALNTEGGRWIVRRFNRQVHRLVATAWRLGILFPFVICHSSFAVEPPAVTATTNGPHLIDLATVLRLAGAQNLDVAIARERVKEAQAQHDQARMQFLPWLSPGVGYKRHDGNIQDVAGNVFDATKQSYTAGAALAAQLDLGDAIYKSLSSRQLVIAAEGSAEARRQESVYTAATGYFELARAHGAAGAAREGVRIAEDYAGQVRRAVEAGIAFQGDVFRAEVQVEKNRILVRQAEEQRQIAAARLAQTLRLPPTTDLAPQDAELAPLSLLETNASLDSLVARALGTRPELRQSSALRASAEQSRRGAQYGPWVPTLGAQYFYGGLAGGRDDHFGDFDRTSDLLVGLSWRIGPGGLFDRSRIRAAEARERATGLELEKVRDEVVRQVVEAHSRTRSLADQLGSAQRALTAAEQSLKYSLDRKEFGVGAVLEAVQAEQELTRARLDYLSVLAEHNKAQFASARATGLWPRTAITGIPMKE
jgi:outer membrane protein TolC